MHEPPTGRNTARKPLDLGKTKNMTEYKTVVLAREGHVATVTLNRPDEGNTINAAMAEELGALWAELARDEQVWAIVLAGSGANFCLGADSNDGSALRFTSMDFNVGKPVIAAIAGLCGGAALAFVADSDIVIASSSATFCDGRTTQGQVSTQGTLRLARKMPLEAVMRMALLGEAEKLQAARAFQLGMVSELVDGDVVARAQELAASLAVNSPSAMFHSRHAVWESLNMGLEDAMEYGFAFVTKFAHKFDDAKEGARAFMEKRAPAWKYAPPPGQNDE